VTLFVTLHSKTCLLSAFLSYSRWHRSPQGILSLKRQFIVYFVLDARKAGGAYMEISGRIKKLIPHEKLLIMNTSTRIPVDNIVEVTASYRFNDSKPLVQSVLPKES